MSEFNDELSAFPVQTRIVVQWGDMDAAQHVNNLMYLKWFETGRIDYFSLLGEKVIFNDDKPGFILASQQIKYIFPITFPDEVIVGVRVAEMKEDRFTMECKIYSLRHQRLAAIAQGVVVTFDYHQQKKAPIPEDMRTRIRNLDLGT